MWTGTCRGRQPATGRVFSAKLPCSRRQHPEKFGPVDELASNQMPHFTFGLPSAIDGEQRSAERFLPKLLQ
jgi:hypothetical protein